MYTECDLPKLPSKRAGGGKKSKTKGKAGERDIVNFLNEVTGKNWMRVPNSGAHVGASNRTRLIQMTRGQIDVFLGDIIPPDNLKYRFIIESKNYKDVPFFNVLKDGNQKNISEWLDQLEHDLISYKRIKVDSRLFIGLLVFKITRKGTYVVVNHDYMMTLFKNKYGIISTVLPYLSFYRDKIDGIDDNYGREYRIFDFENFIKQSEKFLFEDGVVL